MNENLNLVEILKDCPKGTKLYSPIFGEVELDYVDNTSDYPINVKIKDGIPQNFTLHGELCNGYGGECTLFPSRSQRDWSRFKKKLKFNSNTLKPFDKVLVRNSDSENWMIQLFSHVIEGEAGYPYLCINNPYKYCIPYDDNTKHLVGALDEAPEFYKYWED